MRGSGPRRHRPAASGSGAWKPRARSQRRFASSARRGAGRPASMRSAWRTRALPRKPLCLGPASRPATRTKRPRLRGSAAPPARAARARPGTPARRAPAASRRRRARELRGLAHGAGRPTKACCPTNAIGRRTSARAAPAERNARRSSAPLRCTRPSRPLPRRPRPSRRAHALEGRSRRRRTRRRCRGSRAGAPRPRRGAPPRARGDGAGGSRPPRRRRARGRAARGRRRARARRGRGPGPRASRGRAQEPDPAGPRARAELPRQPAAAAGGVEHEPVGPGRELVQDARDRARVAQGAARGAEAPARVALARARAKPSASAPRSRRRAAGGARSPAPLKGGPRLVQRRPRLHAPQRGVEAARVDELLVAARPRRRGRPRARRSGRRGGPSRAGGR